MALDLVGRIYQNARVIRGREIKRLYSPRHFHASESGDCRRELALRRNGTPVERAEDPSGILRLEDGHVHHEAVRSIIERLPGITLTNAESDEVLFVELEGYLPFIITGHCDGIVHDDSEDEGYVLEVKGLNHFSFQKLRTGQLETLKATYPKAIPQARIYMAMFEQKKALILVKNKNTSELKQFIIEHEEDKFMKLLKKFGDITQALQKGEVPLCDFLKGSNQCRFCNYPSLCGR